MPSVKPPLGAIRVASNSRLNRLLGAIPENEWDRFEPHLTPFLLNLGDVVYEPGAIQTHVYFPTTAIVSLLYEMENGSSAEIAVIGREGLVGSQNFMGSQSSTHRAIVQSGGEAYRMRTHFVVDEFMRGGPVQQIFLRYTQALLTQMAQTAACNRHHTVDQQLCRWMLMSIDRLDCDELQMTQELMANMLGVRREGVSEAAGKLQAAGLITFKRGKVTVLDRAGLESRVCECYAAVVTESARLLPWENAAHR